MQVQQLPRRLGAAGAVKFQIPLFCLPLPLLLLLELAPAGAGFVAALLEGRALGLTGKHGITPIGSWGGGPGGRRFTLP